MIDNYLVDARQRFDLDNEMKAKQKLVTNSPYVFTNLEFRSYDFILRLFVMISFLIRKEIEKKKLFWTDEKFVFSFNCSNWKVCGKNSWNKLVKTSDEFVKEQMEEHEKMKRDIYLNGGYVDCVNPGCIDQGTAETSYLCKSCFHEQTVARKQQQQPLSTSAKSTGWLTILQSLSVG